MAQDGRVRRLGRLLVRVEAQRGRVYAVALAGRRGAVVEDMTLMRPAHGAVHLSATHEEATVFLGLDVIAPRRPEARPARAGVVLGLRAEEGLPATHATVDALSFVVPVLTRECSLCALHARHAVLLGRELVLPLLLGLLDLSRRICHVSDSSTRPRPRRPRIMATRPPKMGHVADVCTPRSRYG